MKKNIKNKEIIFLAAAVLITIFLIFSVAYSISFIKSNLGAALGSDSNQKKAPLEFKFEKLKEIGIISE